MSLSARPSTFNHTMFPASSTRVPYAAAFGCCAGHRQRFWFRSSLHACTGNHVHRIDWARVSCRFPELSLGTATGESGVPQTGRRLLCWGDGMGVCPFLDLSCNFDSDSDFYRFRVAFQVSNDQTTVARQVFPRRVQACVCRVIECGFFNWMEVSMKRSMRRASRFPGSVAAWGQATAGSARSREPFATLPARRSRAQSYRR